MADPLQSLKFKAGLFGNIFDEQQSQLGQAAELGKQKKGGLLGGLIGGKLGKFAVEKLLGTYLKAQFGPMGLLMAKALATGLGTYAGTKIGTGKKKDIGAEHGAGTGLLGSGYDRLGSVQDSISNMATSHGLGTGIGTAVSGLTDIGLGKAKDVLGAGLTPKEGYGGFKLDTPPSDEYSILKESGLGQAPSLTSGPLMDTSKGIKGSLISKVPMNLSAPEGIDNLLSSLQDEQSPLYADLSEAILARDRGDIGAQDIINQAYAGTGNDWGEASKNYESLFLQQGGLANTLLGMQMGGMPGVSSPIPYQDGGRVFDEEKVRKMVKQYGEPAVGDTDLTKFFGSKGLGRLIENYGADSNVDIDLSKALIDQLAVQNAFGGKLGQILSIPASEVGDGEGLRYYEGIGQYRGSLPDAGLQYPAIRDAIKKMTFTPQDSIPKARLGYQQGGLTGYQDGGYLRQYNMGGSVAQQPLSYQLGGLLKYKRSPVS
jgi:hypothetical protein